MTKALLLALMLGLAGTSAWLVLDEDERAAPATPASPPPAAAPTAATARPAPAATAIPVAPAAPSGPANAPEPAAEPKDDAATLDQAGRAQLAQGLEARRDGRSVQARGLFEAAATALGQAIELSGERVDPWTLQSMAQAQLELGNDVDAIAWADRALQRVRAGGGDDYEAFRSATLTMNVGIVYYRAGQRQTGVAYMDQAISMAPTAFDRADFADLKAETVGGG